MVLIDEIKSKDWQLDWESGYGILSRCIATDKYFEPMQREFGCSLHEFLIVAIGNQTFGYLEVEDLDRFGRALLPLVETLEKAKEFSKKSKEIADYAVSEVDVSGKQFFNNIEHIIDVFNIYGVYQNATKALFERLPLDFDSAIKDIIEDIRKYSETFYKELPLFDRLGEYITSKEVGYSVSEILAMTTFELITYRDTGVLPSSEKLHERSICSGIYRNSENDIRLISGEEVKEIKKKWMSNYKDGQVSGVTAYGGQIQGICKVVNKFKGADIKKGEILVSVMTTPDAVPLMKKSAAIVTDGGGMLCHAAIVARELKIPCVIGTKIATQVLKDGDLVEVDADNGIVKIIEKHEEQ
jgi:phosphohistidine swiveling domain-containing protein